MADDELHIRIEKCFWPKTTRALMPVLRQLGDKNNNITIVAMAAKQEIMVKGAKKDVDAALPGLKEIIEEHFPDAPLPEELGGQSTAPEEEEEVAPEPAPVYSAPVTSAKASKPSPAPEASALKSEAAPIAAAKSNQTRGAAGVIAKFQKKQSHEVKQATTPVKQRHAAPPALLWECVRRSSSFRRKPNKELKRAFSAEAGNLMSWHCGRYSGLTGTALDVCQTKIGSKEGIELIRTSGSSTQQRHPDRMSLKIGLHKNPMKGLHTVQRQVEERRYRKSLSQIAMQKYLKVQQSFKKKKRIVKSRRAQKSAD
jgi:hypothetical protein